MFTKQALSSIAKHEESIAARFWTNAPPDSLLKFQHNGYGVLFHCEFLYIYTHLPAELLENQTAKKCRRQACTGAFSLLLLPSVSRLPKARQVLFKEALDNGTMEGFFKLICYFQTQSEPAYCGLASLSMVLNALAVDPGRKWKGPWRWFDESMLDCCEPLEKIKDKGISFEQVVCLAHCAGANVEAFRTNKSNIDEFRTYVISCSRSDDCHVISSYHRGTFQQTGTGHFSPIGGYHAGKDLVLILDVARFKYPPHWVPLTLLWKAMDTVVGATGLRRGFMLISSRQTAPSLFYTLSCKHESWVRTAEYMIDDVPVLLSSDTIKDVKHAISTVFTYLPSDFSEFIKWVGELHKQGDDGQCISQEENRRISIKDNVLKEVQETDLYKLVTDTLSSEKLICQNEMATANQDGLPNIAASGYCKGAGFLAGKSCLLDEVCSQETGVRSNRVNDHKPVTVSENAINCRTGACGYSRTQPAASNDVLTELLLALPPQTWMGIKEKDILQEISCLVSLEGLSPLLKEEILHMRVQLLLPKRCTDNKIEDDLGAL